MVAVGDSIVWDDPEFPGTYVVVEVSDVVQMVPADGSSCGIGAGDTLFADLDDVEAMEQLAPGSWRIPGVSPTT